MSLLLQLCLWWRQALVLLALLSSLLQLWHWKDALRPQPNRTCSAWEIFPHRPLVNLPGFTGSWDCWRRGC